MIAALIGIAVYYAFKNAWFKEYMLFFDIGVLKKLPRYHPLFMMIDRFGFSAIAAALG